MVHYDFYLLLICYTLSNGFPAGKRKLLFCFVQFTSHSSPNYFHIQNYSLLPEQENYFECITGSSLKHIAKRRSSFRELQIIFPFRFPHFAFVHLITLLQFLILIIRFVLTVFIPQDPCYPFKKQEANISASMYYRQRTDVALSTS